MKNISLSTVIFDEYDNNVICVEYTGDYNSMSFKAVAKYKVTSEVSVTIEVWDPNSSTAQADITLTIPINSIESEERTGVPFAIKEISPNEDAVQMYTNGGIKRV